MSKGTGIALSTYEAVLRVRAATEDPGSDESLAWWRGMQADMDVRTLLHAYEQEQAHVAHLRRRICEMEQGGDPANGGKGHCSVCAFGCYGV